MVIKDPCLHSGSVAPMLSTLLSGDVLLPSQVQPGNELVLIDRKNSTLTWVNPTTCAVRLQAPVGGFSSSPYDLVTVGNKGYVTRFKQNPGNPDEGSDVLVIDAATAAVKSRIDLRPWASKVDGATIVPYPTRAVQVKDKIYVTLNNLSADFNSAGVGTVAIIDPATDTATGSIVFPTLKNCGGIAAATSATGGPALVVTCGGAFADGDKQVDASGIAWVDLAATPPAVTVVPGKAFGGRPPSYFEVSVVSQALAFTVVAGDFGDTATVKDAVWAFDFTGGAPRKIFDATGSFVLSTQVDAGTHKLYVLDAAKVAPKVHVFAMSATGDLTQPPTDVVSSPSSGLPPRSMGWY
jgi:hypothetical protein